MKFLIEIFSTLFFIGYLPAGGTLATLASFPIVVWLSQQTIVFKFLFLIFFTVIAIVLSSVAEKYVFCKKDAIEIVIDEVLGFIIATFMIDITKIQVLLVAFIIFRFFDITKIFIKKLQNLPSGIGVVADDIFCGVVTNFIMRAILQWL